MLHVVSYVDLKSLANSNYSMDIHGVIGAGWSWMEYLEKVSMSFTALDKAQLTRVLAKGLKLHLSQLLPLLTMYTNLKAYPLGD